MAALLNSSPAGSQSGVNLSFSGEVFKYFSAFFTCVWIRKCNQRNLFSDMIKLYHKLSLHNKTHFWLASASSSFFFSRMDMTEPYFFDAYRVFTKSNQSTFPSQEEILGNNVVLILQLQCQSSTSSSVDLPACCQLTGGALALGGGGSATGHVLPPPPSLIDPLRIPPLTLPWRYTW